VNTLLNALTEACRKHKFTAKKLVVDNLQGGHQLLEGMARSGEAWLNVTPVTPLQMAMELAGPELMQQGINILSEGQILHLLDEELTAMRDKGRLKYFARLEGDEGLAGILLPAILELRAAGIKAADINEAAFVDHQKGTEIKDLLQAYESRLQHGKQADTAAVYQAAADLLENYPACDPGTLYLIPEQLEFSAMEYAFIDACTKNGRIILPEEPLFDKAAAVAGKIKHSDLKGLHFEPKPSINSKDKGFNTALAYLEHPDAAPPDSAIAITISRAYGPANEVTYLLQQLRLQNIPLDQVRVCCTDAAVYVPLFYTLAAQYALPVTFGEGYAAAFTRPGKLLDGLLSWLAENYLANHLYQLFYSGLINTANPTYLVRTLRSAKIGWGYERYNACLKRAIEKAQKDIENYQARHNCLQTGAGTAAPAAAPDIPDYLKINLGNAKKAEQLIHAILNALPKPGPAPENKVDFPLLCSGLAKLIKDYARITVPEDAAAAETIIEALNDAALSYSGSLELKAAVKRIKRRLAGVRICASGSKSGHLHITGINKGEWAPRPYTFLVGLQSGSFPGSGLQDPILLDRERKQISPSLALRALQPSRNRLRLNRLLASCCGHLYLSYSSFSPVEARPTMPAASLLQVYRLLHQDPAADYTKLEKALALQASYYPSDPAAALFIDQWWLYLALLDRKQAVDSAAVAACFSGIKAGLTAKNNRSSDQFTPFDGLIYVDPQVVDPTLNPKATLSASRLEVFGRCPFAFFVQTMLRVEPPDDYELKPGTWLDAATRGHLLHQIYAEFMNRVIGKRRDPKKEESLIRKIGSELIEARKTEVPPPSEVVYSYEKENLLKELDTFLKVEQAMRKDGYEPLYLEAPFGTKPDAIKKAGAGLIDPVEIEIKNGRSFKLRGLIDRIDRIADNPPRYGVWDYKTGSTYNYEENQYLNSGSQLQHALYAIAAEKILEDTGITNPKVSIGGYVFPTLKGEGRLYIRDQSNRPELLSALSLMFKLIKAGTFCLTAEDRCAFCDYKIVCRAPAAREQVKVKLANQANQMLEPWKELQEYE
jgi:ATP-dependent helicase/nuclease subunit B